MKNKIDRKRKKKKISNSERMYYILMIIAYLYLGFACMYKYIRYESLDKCILELMMILSLSLVIEYVHIIKNNGNDVRKKLSKKTKKKDRLKRYIGECFILSITITSIMFLAIASNRLYINFYDFPFGVNGNISIVILSVAFLVILDLFVIGLIFNYIVSEKLIKRLQ